MKREFVKNTNALRFAASIRMMHERGAREACMLLVTGRPGEGKTTTLYNWAAGVGAVMLTAEVDSTPRRLMVDLAQKLSIVVTQGFEREIEAVIAKHNIAIILDEAGFALHNNAACIEKLRGITDKTNTLLVVVIMQNDIGKLNSPRLQQLASRFGEPCSFKEVSFDDVKLACGQLGEVPMADDLVAHIHKVSGASMRQVMGDICKVEETAQRRPELQRANIMHLVDVKGVVLCNALAQAMRNQKRTTTATPATSFQGGDKA
jgi:hypothetical protein